MDLGLQSQTKGPESFAKDWQCFIQQQDLPKFHKMVQEQKFKEDKETKEEKTFKGILDPIFGQTLSLNPVVPLPPLEESGQKKRSRHQPIPELSEVEKLRQDLRNAEKKQFITKGMVPENMVLRFVSLTSLLNELNTRRDIVNYQVCFLTPQPPTSKSMIEFKKRPVKIPDFLFSEEEIAYNRTLFESCFKKANNLQTKEFSQDLEVGTGVYEDLSNYFYSNTILFKDTKIRRITRHWNAARASAFEFILRTGKMSLDYPTESFHPFGQQQPLLLSSSSSSCSSCSSAGSSSSSSSFPKFVSPASIELLFYYPSFKDLRRIWSTSPDYWFGGINSSLEMTTPKSFLVALVDVGTSVGKPSSLPLFLDSKGEKQALWYQIECDFNILPIATFEIDPTIIL
jgi:hypothetical protein